MGAAIVTGGATRVGRALCLRLARRGHPVVVHYRSSAAEADSLVAEIHAAGGQALAVQADLVDEAACRSVMDATVAWRGAPGILVNNASIFTRETLAETTEASLVAEFWPNFFAPVLLTRFFAEASAGGTVINLLDRRIKSNDTRFFAYTLAKKSLANFTELAAVALAPAIKVFGIAPGPILPPPGQDMAYLKEKGGKRLLDDTLDPEAIADALEALLGLRGATGQTLFIDAGQHLLGNGV
jgi:NAD(P)-dependent dehydrogenase (short-subunit alcohol dehydrogenase family)